MTNLCRRCLLSLLSALLLVVAGGCGGDDLSDKTKSSATSSAPTAPGSAGPQPSAAPTGPPHRLTVSLDRIATRHPLQRDVVRLVNAERRLRRILDAPRLVTPQKRVLLPPLAPSSDPDESALPPSFVLAVRRVRARLEQDALRRVARLARELRERNERAVARRRAELLAALDARLADARARAQQLASRETNEKLSQLALTLANLTLQRDALTTNINLLAVVRDAAAIEAEIAKLRANPATRFISERAHFEFRLQNNARERAEVEATITALRAGGREQVRVEVAEARARFLADVNARVQQYAQSLLAGRGRRGGRASDVLTMLADAARAVSRENSRGLPSVASYQRRIAVAGAINADNVRAAAERIGRQRTRLAQFIRADTRAAVLDAASARNVVVAFTTTPASLVEAATGLASAASLSGAEREAARWIFPSAIPGRDAARRQ